MFGDDDDGGAFSIGMPTGGSKLSSLFGMNQHEGGNESLKYTAPKQPKTKEVETKSQKPDALALLFACACHSFKYLDGQFVKQGKLGAAVLGNFAAKDYKILLYISQKKPVANATIHANFQFNVQSNNYASFYDDQSQSWSLCFDNESQLMDFTKWVTLAKFNVQGNVMVTQDFNVIDGQPIDKGDNVEMQYTGWLHNEDSFGKVFESNKDTGKLFKFKVGKGKVIKGWDIGVVGMKKGSKRMLVIPPELAYGAKAVGDRVPPNSTLIFQLEVTRIKFSNPQPDSDTVSLLSVDGTTKETHIGPERTSVAKSETPEVLEAGQDSERLGTNDTLKGRTKSISDQLSKSPENTKSKLLERMSKMGQAMIHAKPVLHSSISSDSTSESARNETTPHSQPRHVDPQLSNESQPTFRPESPKPQLRRKPEPVPRPFSATPVTSSFQPTQATQQHDVTTSLPHQQAFEHNPMFTPHAQLALYQSPQAMQAAMLASMGGFQAQPMFPQQQQHQQQTSGISSMEMNLMMTDSRLKHSELKTDLTRLIDKVDAVSMKLAGLENLNKQVQPVQAIPQQQFYAQNHEMEANVLMQNITRICKENEKFRSECEEKTVKIDKLNERMTDLLTKNQQYFEKSNQLIANQTDSMQSSAAQALAKVSSLEQQNIKLEADLSSLQTQLLHSQTKHGAASQREIELMATIENLKLELKRTKENASSVDSMSSEHESVVEALTLKLKNEKKEQKLIKIKLYHLEEEQAELKVECEGLRSNLNDLKNKRKDDKKRYEEEIEEIKTQHEDELKATRQRYKKDAGSENEKLIKLEEELREKHETKLKQALLTKEGTHREVVKQLTDETQKLSAEVETLKKKLLSITEESRKEHEVRLNEKLNELSKLHESQLDECKHEVVKITDELSRAQNMIANVTAEDDLSTELKAEIESQAQTIALLQKEKDQVGMKLIETNKDRSEAEKKVEEATRVIEKLNTAVDEAYDKGIQNGRANVKTISTASYQQGFEEGKASVQANPSVASSSTRGEVNTEVKRIMNTVFFQLREKFRAGENYDGQSVVGAILNTIKEVTLKMVQEDQSESDEESGDEEDDDEESDEDEDEEGEEGGELSIGTDEVDVDIQYKDTASKSDDSDEKKRLHVGRNKDSVDNGKQAEETKSENTPEIAPSVVTVESVECAEEESIHERNTKGINHQIQMSGSDSVKSIKQNVAADTVGCIVHESDMSFSSANDERSGENVEEPLSHTRSQEELEEDNYATDEGDSMSDHETERLTNPLQEESTGAVQELVNNEAPKEEKKSSVLEQMGIDSSIFGEASEESAKAHSAVDEPLFSPQVETAKAAEMDSQDESSLFFGGSASKTKSEGTSKVEKKKPTLFDEKAKPSLFSDEDDEDDGDDIFKAKNTEPGKAKTSAFNRSPPPLFGDDDDDVNWI